MKKLKNRSTAMLVALVVIVFGTLIGVHRSVGRETAKIEAQFYEGVYLQDEQYTQPGIDAQLMAKGDAALGLITVAKDYAFASDMTDALRTSRESLLDADTIEEKYEANLRLEQAWRQLRDNLTAHAGNLPESFESYVSTLSGAQGVIEHSAYNTVVSEFRNGTMSAFPVNILKNLAFVNYPDYFGTEG